MGERRGWTRIGGTLLAAAGLFACGADDSVDNGGSDVWPGDSYFGGQTGSLIPGCGLAPLSAAGSAVPAGDALGVLYTRDCPGQQQMLAIQGVSGVALELVPLDGKNSVFLVRSDQSLSGGNYQLELGNGASGDVHVQAEPAALPATLAELKAVPPESACAETLRFELPLDEAMLAYAPLARFEASLDGRSPHVWIDYGALPIEDGPDGKYGVLELPRCSNLGCLTGPHSLQLTADIAGEAQQPAATSTDFDVPCADDGGGDPSACSLGPLVPSRSASAWLSSALGLLLWRRLRRRSSR